MTSPRSIGLFVQKSLILADRHPMSYEMNELLELVLEEGASDLHIQVGKPPTLRLHGSMVSVDGPDLTPADTERLMQSIAADSYVQAAKTEGGADFGFAYMVV